MSRNCAHSDMETAPPPGVLFRERVLHDVMLHEVARIASPPSDLSREVGVAWGRSDETLVSKHPRGL